MRKRYAPASNKLWLVFGATPDLLRKAPKKLTALNGTGAYPMEARGPRCENGFRFVARRVSLVVAFLLCLGVFLLTLPATGSEVPSAVGMTNLARVDLATNGKGHPLDGIYVVMPGEEAKDADKHPLNAELLTMLLLLGCFGLSVGWLLRNAQYGRAVRTCVLCLFASSTALWTIIVCVIGSEVVGKAEQHQDPVGLH